MTYMVWVASFRNKQLIGRLVQPSFQACDRENPADYAWYKAIKHNLKL